MTAVESGHQAFVDAAERVAEQLGVQAKSYFGRGMYGKNCFAVVLPSMQSVFDWFFQLGVECGDELCPPRGACTDNFGAFVVVYWPSCKLFGGPEDAVARP